MAGLDLELIHCSGTGTSVFRTTAGLSSHLEKFKNVFLGEGGPLGEGFKSMTSSQAGPASFGEREGLGQPRPDGIPRN